MPNPRLSVVIPIHNEEPNLRPLYDELRAALDTTGQTWELLLVDDGSTDGGPAVMRELFDSDRRITVIRFSRSHGQTAALKSGFDRARGEIVISLDGDLQNDPADIAPLLARLEEGADVVCGWRRKRREPFVSRVFPSRVANLLIRLITGLKIHDSGCTLRVYRAPVIRSLELYGEMHRLIPALAHAHGALVTEIEVNHRPRAGGESKYVRRFSLGFGLKRPVHVILDLVAIQFFYNYFSRPLHIFGMLGFFSNLAAAVSFGAVVAMKILHEHNMTGNPLLYLTVLLVLMGGQFFALGLLGEITMRTYYESQSKPIYVIEDVLEHES